MKSTPKVITKEVIVGASADASKNVRIHRGGDNILQFVAGDDTTLDGIRSPNEKLIPGMIPVGGIISWIPGYFSNSSNGSYTYVLGSGNNEAGANAYLNSFGWHVCNGSLLNDSESPIFNGAGRYLPNLTDSRFLAGATLAGDTAITDLGAAGGTAGSSTLAHNHAVSTQPTFTAPAHYHGFGLTAAGQSFSGSSGVGGSCSGTTGTESNDHTHGVYSWWGYDTAGNHGVNNGSTSDHGLTRDLTNSTSGRSASHTHTFSGSISGSADISHSHSSSSVSGTIGNTGGSNGDSTLSCNRTNDVVIGSSSNTENRPKYLSTFFIIRVK